MVATLPHPSVVPITIPKTSPMAHPVRQCAVALKATLFSEAPFPCISFSSLPLRVPPRAPGLRLRYLRLPSLSNIPPSPIQGKLSGRVAGWFLGLGHG